MRGREDEGQHMSAREDGKTRAASGVATEAVEGGTVGEAVAFASAVLGGPAAPPARQQARDLVAAVLDVPRFWPTANAARALSPAERDAIERAVQRAARGMPLAYAARRAAFRTLSLYVDERALIPRPETEMLVDLVLDSTSGGSGVAIDVGTGSGCIAIALAAEGKFERVIGTDVSADALAVAERNYGELGSWIGDPGATNGELHLSAPRARLPDPRSPLPAPRSSLPVEFRLGSYLSPCAGLTADVVVSNPPYISEDEESSLPPDVRDWEPRIALIAEDDGMAAIAAIAHEAATVLRGGGLLALEVDSRRAGRAADLVTAAGGYRDVVVRPDLTGRARFVLARRAEA